MNDHPRDSLDAVASATEYTGALPAMPWNDNGKNARRALRVRRPSGAVFRRAKD